MNLKEQKGINTDDAFSCEKIVDAVKQEALNLEETKPGKWLFRFICKNDCERYMSVFSELVEDIRLSDEVSYMGFSYVRGEGIDLSKDIMFIFGEDAQVYSDIWYDAYNKIVNVAVVFGTVDFTSDLSGIHDVFFINEEESVEDIKCRFKLFVSYLLYNTGALQMIS